MATPEQDDSDNPEQSRGPSGPYAGGTRGREWDRRFGDAIVSAALPACGTVIRTIAQSDAAEPVVATPTTTSMIDSGSC